MKGRHVAALALLGWYLMVPPMVGSTRYDDNAPLNKWKVFLSFDTAADCESFAVNEAKTAKHADTRTAALNAVCIATDDPRLKEK